MNFLIKQTINANVLYIGNVTKAPLDLQAFSANNTFFEKPLLKRGFLLILLDKYLRKRYNYNEIMF